MKTKTNPIKKLEVFSKNIFKRGLDGYVVTNELDQRYLMNFFFYEGETALLVSKRGVFCCTRGLYKEELERKYPSFTIIPADGAQIAAAVKKVKQLKLKKTGFDGNKIPYFGGKLLEKAAKSVPGIIDEMRKVKTEDEIAIIRDACRIAHNAAETAMKKAKAGMTEMDLAIMIESYFRSQGASGTSFETNISFGINGVDTHHRAEKQYKLKKEMPVLIDIGCVYKDYTSDISRSWWYGTKPDPEYTKIWNVVKKAHDTAIKLARPNMTGKQIDAIARDIITKAGYGEYFTHRLGHGMGMQVHEGIGPDQMNEEKLGVGSVFSIEPGIYLPGKFGVRIEETVVMRKNGPEVLTKK